MRAVPRFGHSSDFSSLFSDDQGQVSDYAQGLLFIGCFLLTVYIIWFIFIIILKCIPHAGFLSGRRFTNHSRAKTVRIVFAIAAILSMVFTVLLVTEGITNLQDTLTTVNNSYLVSVILGFSRGRDGSCDNFTQSCVLCGIQPLRKFQELCRMQTKLHPHCKRWEILPKAFVPLLLRILEICALVPMILNS